LLQQEREKKSANAATKGKKAGTGGKKKASGTAKGQLQKKGSSSSQVGGGGTPAPSALTKQSGLQPMADLPGRGSAVSSAC